MLSSFRLDTTLIDFTDMKCQRGDLSFIFNGDAVPSESFVVLDNEQKVYQRIHHEVGMIHTTYSFNGGLTSTSHVTPLIFLGVGDGDGGRSGHFDEQRHLLGHPVHQIHHLLPGAERLALPRRQNRESFFFYDGKRWTCPRRVSFLNDRVWVSAESWSWLQERVGNFLADFYLVNGLVLESRKRREHLSEEDILRNKAIMESLSKGGNLIEQNFEVCI